MFICDKCGECCRNLDKSPIYAELDSGNGTCKYLDGKLCTVYENRPLLCRIDESYEAFFKNIMSLNEYYRLNYESCIKLKNQL
jgi:Fe-S-cluster containining protein